MDQHDDDDRPTIIDFFPLSPYRNPPAIERILQLLWMLQNNCEQQLWIDHNHEECEHCPCVFCEHTGGLLYNVRAAVALLEGAVRFFPAMDRRWAALARESGDDERAAELEARADDRERDAGPATEGITTSDAPVIVVLNALREQAGMV
jgi:hypothetical protein